jgi:hydrogenase maturation factor HypF (carbamoyltransferase family)
MLTSQLKHIFMSGGLSQNEYVLQEVRKMAKSIMPDIEVERATT